MTKIGHGFGKGQIRKSLIHKDLWFGMKIDACIYERAIEETTKGLDKAMKMCYNIYRGDRGRQGEREERRREDENRKREEDRKGKDSEGGRGDHRYSQ
jgi:hypothetical protein